MSSFCIHILLLLALAKDTNSRPSALLLNNATEKSRDDLSSDEAGEVWLDDITKDYLYEMQADFPGGEGLDVTIGTCPPPPEDQVPSSSGCKALKCVSDQDCDGARERCCNNGCIFTCMPAVPQPPVIDWIREPPRNFKSGYSWLIHDTKEDQHEDPVEWCSTSSLLNDEDALLCPHGYQCHIEDPGDEATGIPNRGRCVKERIFNTESGKTFQLKSSSKGDGTCIFRSQVLVEGSTFFYNHHTCTCGGGLIECIVKDTGQQ